MSKAARESILARLHGVPKQPMLATVTPPPGNTTSLDERVQTFRERMEAVGTEIYEVSRDAWVSDLTRILVEKKISRLLYAPDRAVGADITSAWENGGDTRPELVAYDREIEDFRAELFDIDAGITSTRGAIAHSGSLILWPTPEEPRLMSLVPPTHIAIVDADAIHPTFEHAVQAENWQSAMPTNALLISGPSKTADIEGILVYGAHGPKNLIVLIRR